MNKNLESVQALQFVDDGAESTSVDLLMSQPGDDAPAKEPEKGAETEEGKKKPEESGKETDSEKKAGKETDTTDKEKSGGPDEDAVPRGVQKKISKLTKKLRGFERDYKSEKEKRVAVEKRLDALLKQGSREDAEKAPVPEEYETDHDYHLALAQYAVKLQSKQAEGEKPGGKEPEPGDDEKPDFDEKSLRKMHRKGIKKYGDDDWDDTVEDVMIPEGALDVLTSLDNAEDVIYYLGNNPDKAEDIEDMSAAKAGAELQRLSLKLQSKKSTKAPDPINPVKSSGGGQKSPDEMSMPEYRAWREKQKGAF